MRHREQRDAGKQKHDGVEALGHSRQPVSTQNKPKIANTLMNTTSAGSSVRSGPIPARDAQASTPNETSPMQKMTPPATRSGELTTRPPPRRSSARS